MLNDNNFDPDPCDKLEDRSRETKIDECFACGVMHYCEKHHIFRREYSNIAVNLCKSCHLKIEKMKFELWSVNEAFVPLITLLNRSNPDEKLLLLRLFKTCIHAIEIIDRIESMYKFDSECDTIDDGFDEENNNQNSY